MRASAILVAAGKGLRFKSRTPKPLVKIDAKPIIIYSLLALERHPLVNEIILVVNSANKNAITREVKQYRIAKVRATVQGGRRRQDSVFCGLKVIEPAARLVLVHDAARPFVRAQDISAVIKEAAKTGAAILGVPVKGTIKTVARRSSLVARRLAVKKTLDRNTLWEIQTPQVFRKDLILEAYRKFGRQDVTDDAMLVEKMGRRVSIVAGSYSNIKITTPDDLAIAKAISKYV